ncbi:hypothetical protein D7Y23_21805 [Corallococcus sp. AB050B]|nr:hypothetical protein D7Y23_21805 [Corallococcus sp. AB050B]
MDNWLARAELEQKQKAYSAARQAVEYHREQAALDPEAHLPALIDSLMAQSQCQHALSATDAALDSATEAVDLLRGLAQARPDTFLPRLATELRDLGRMQGIYGRAEAALASLAEAVAILRRLAEVNPDAFLPELVNGLSCLADRQSMLGQGKEQRASMLEEVTILRTLAEARPGEFRPALAKTLSYISRYMRGVGSAEALAFLTEAVVIGRQLVAEGLDTYATTLALHLNELSRSLSWTDQAEASLALALAEEALEVSWRVYPANPSDFYRLVEIVLENLLSLHQELGSKPEGEVLERINAFKAWRPGEQLRRV